MPRIKLNKEEIVDPFAEEGGPVSVDEYNLANDIEDAEIVDSEEVEEEKPSINLSKEKVDEGKPTIHLEKEDFIDDDDDSEIDISSLYTPQDDDEYKRNKALACGHSYIPLIIIGAQGLSVGALLYLMGLIYFMVDFRATILVWFFGTPFFVVGLILLILGIKKKKIHDRARDYILSKER